MFMSFQEQLKKMRDVDDKIIYALNTSIPTESFKGQLSPSEKCTELYGKLNSTHESRHNIIKNCITVTANRVKELKTKKEDNPDNIYVYKDFKSEQRKVNIEKPDRIFPRDFLTIFDFYIIFLFRPTVAITAIGDERRGHNQRTHHEAFL